MRRGLPWLTMTMMLIFLLSELQSAIAAGTIYVDDDTCPSTGSGTLGDPYCGDSDGRTSGRIQCRAYCGLA